MTSSSSSYRVLILVEAMFGWTVERDVLQWTLPVVIEPFDT